MWFWWFMVCFDLLIPLCMLIGGSIMQKHCPKKINAWFGYRTVRSMKNIDTWKFAHAYIGKLWWKIGWMLLVPSFLIHIPLYHASELLIAVIGLTLECVQLIAMLLSIVFTEKALKQTFHDDGTSQWS